MVKFWTRTLLVTATIGLVASPAGFSQTPSAPSRPAFEVASIKPNASGEQRSRTGIRAGGRLMATNVTLKELIMTAYQINYFQISGGPGWIESARFDVDAVGSENVSAQQVYLMLRALLEDRFHLKYHLTPKQTDVYVLGVAKSGFKLKEVKEEDSPNHGVQMDLRWIHSDKTATVTAFASALENLVGKVVLDKTGLSCFYNIDLRWGKSESGDAGASFFTAIQEQLGLRLDSEKQPVDILVIDSAEQPTPNGDR